MQPTRKRIIATAMDMIERNGVAAVSMHGLATELGCSMLSLYSQVPSWSALLDGVAETLLADALVADAAILIAPGGWRDYVRAHAMAFWQVARTRPRCSSLALTRPTALTAALRSLEVTLASLREAGFAGPESVRIVHVVAAFLVGSLQREVGESLGMRDGDAGDDRQRKRPSGAAFPYVTSLRAELARTAPDGDFEFGLELLLQACPSDEGESADLVYPAVGIRQLAELNAE
jgi:AcrR family transcriptional regulator